MRPKNTTATQCAGFVASIGCPHRLEICHDYGRALPAGELTYRTEHEAAQRRAALTTHNPWKE